MSVQILTFTGCPNAEPAFALVAEVSRELGFDPAVEAVLVEDAVAAERLRFLGSPTIRVDGRDVEPGAGERTDFALSCRVYSTPAGTSGIPPRSWVREALARGRTDA